MKILFDSQIFRMQKYGGISRYFCELFKYFNKISNITYELPIKYSDNEYLNKIYPFSKKTLSSKFIFPNINPKIQNIINKSINIISTVIDIAKTRKILIGDDFDIFHPTYYSSYFLKYLKNKPLVLTVHDMIGEIYPEYFSNNAKSSKKMLNYF